MRFLLSAVLGTVRRHDPLLAGRIELAFHQHGLLTGGYTESQFLERARKFSEAALTQRLPRLTGRYERRPKSDLFRVLIEYGRALLEERQKPRSPLRGEAAHRRAQALAIGRLGYKSEATFEKDLKLARKQFPELARIAKGGGARFIEV